MWTPLRLKSHHSLGWGTASIPELVARLRSDGIETAALADLDNLSGQVRFHVLCRTLGVRPVTGVEVTAVRANGDSTRRGSPRVVLLARNREGYRSLCRIVTLRRRASPEEGREAPPDPFRLLTRTEPRGIFVLTDAPDLARRLVAEKVIPRRDLRLLLVRPRPRTTERDLREASRTLDVRVLADPAPLFLEAEDHDFHVFRLAVHRGESARAVRDAGLAAPPERFLPRPRAVRRRFRDVPGAVEETGRVGSQCRLDLLDASPALPRPPGIPAAETHSRLASLLRDRLRGAREEGRCRGGQYERRLDRELAVVRDRGLSGYFLAVGAILEGAARLGIPTGGRGSAVGSLAAHLLGLSAVDPVAAGLHMERFVHRRRRDLPDVDIDVASDRRKELIRWTREHFHPPRVAMASAHHRFGRRSAWREGLKALEVEGEDIDEIVGSLPPPELMDEMEEGRVRAGTTSASVTPPAGLLTCVPPGGPGLVERLVGRPRHRAVHPGGVVITPDALDRHVPLERSGGDLPVTQFDGDALERVGLVKIDLLGSRGLAEMGVAISHLRRTGELEALRPSLEARGPAAIPPDDRDTLRLLDRADTLGCGQIETPALRSVLEQVPIRRIEDLVAVLAVVRPGAASGRAKDRFIRRARGEEEPDLFDPLPSDLLRETHGVLLFEEDIMRVLARSGGFDLEEADELRREILEVQDDARALARLGERFIESARRSGLPRDDARGIWEEVVRFAAYSFNKAHAASYASLAFRAAFLRRHAPVAFACGVLEHHGGSYPLRTIAAAIERWGVRILPPHVNESRADTRPAPAAGPEGAAVRLGLARVGRLSRSTGRRILERRGRGPFRDPDDLLERVDPAPAEFEALVLSGALDGLGPLDPEHYPVPHEAMVNVVRAGRSPSDVEDVSGAGGKGKRRFEGERFGRYRALTRIRNELRFLKMHPSAHPMRVLRADARDEGCVTTRRARRRTGDDVSVAVLLAASRRVVTTGDRVMRFLTLEDEVGVLEAVLLPPAQEGLESRITTPGPYRVDGRVREERGHVHLEIHAMRPFHHRHRGGKRQEEAFRRRGESA